MGSQRVRHDWVHTHTHTSFSKLFWKFGIFLCFHINFLILCISKLHGLLQDEWTPLVCYCRVLTLKLQTLLQNSSVCVDVCALSHVWLFVTPSTVDHQILLSTEFSRREYWSGLPCPSLGDVPDPGIKPTSLAVPPLAGRFFTTAPPGKPLKTPESSLLPLCISFNSGFSK